VSAFYLKPTLRQNRRTRSKRRWVDSDELGMKTAAIVARLLPLAAYAANRHATIARSPFRCASRRAP